MDFQKSLQQAWHIALLNESAMQAVAKDKNSLKPALVLLGLVSLVGHLGIYFFPSTVGMITYRMDLFWVLHQSILSFILFILGILILGFLEEKVFHGRLTMTAFLKVLGHGSVVYFLALYPSFAFPAHLWFFIIVCTVLYRRAYLRS